MFVLFFLTKIANRRSTNLRPNIWEKNLFEKKWWWQCRFKKGQILVVIELPWKMCLLKLTRANDIGQVLIVWGDGTRLCHLALKVFGVTRVLLPRGLPSISRWHTDPELMSRRPRDPIHSANAAAEIFILSSLTSWTSIVKMPIIALCPLRIFFPNENAIFMQRKTLCFFCRVFFVFV